MTICPEVMASMHPSAALCPVPAGAASVHLFCSGGFPPTSEISPLAHLKESFQMAPLPAQALSTVSWSICL